MGYKTRTQTMKGKRHSTEDKIRILREADGGRSIGEICKEKNISEVNQRKLSRYASRLACVTTVW